MYKFIMINEIVIDIMIQQNNYSIELLDDLSNKITTGHNIFLRDKEMN